MLWRDDASYAKEHFITDEELGDITSVQLKIWCCTKTYGVADPGLKDRPTQEMSSSVEFYGKAISYNQPNQLIMWSALQEHPAFCLA